MNDYDIPLLRPRLPETKHLIPYLNRIDDSKIYSNRGPLVRDLEERLANHFQVRKEQIVLLSNATLAIQGLATLLPVQRIQVPDYTFAASGQAVLASGKLIDLVDVRLDDWQLPLPTNSAISEIGFLPVMPFGAPVDIERWGSIQNVIFDAAASFGSTQPDLKGLNLTSAIVYSLHATKVAGCGEGGIAICGSDEIADKLKSWSNFGFNENRIAYTLGTNAKMSEYSAAVVCAVLDDLESELAEWNKSLDIAKKNSIIYGFDSIVSHYFGARPYWIAQFNDKETREKVSKFLFENNIECRSWWSTPLSAMPVFRRFAGPVSNDVAKEICETTLGLPMFRGLSEISIDKISQLVADAMDKKTRN